MDVDITYGKKNPPQIQDAVSLHMDDLWLAEIQCLLNSSELEEPVDGHVVEAIGIKMAKMYLCACVRGKKLGNFCLPPSWRDGGRQANHDTVEAE